MKGDRKLHLVPSPWSTTGRNEPPPTANEERAAAILRDALAAGDEPFACELRAAFAPTPVAATDLDAIVRRALGDESAATAIELKESQKLRAELDGEQAPKGSLLFSELRLAAYPTALPSERHEALFSGTEKRRALSGRPVPAHRLASTMAATLAAAAAIAAGVALVLDGGEPATTGANPSVGLARARSADDLFDAAVPFPRSGNESARVDRIAAARGADLRRNRFTVWGVR